MFVCVCVWPLLFILFHYFRYLIFVITHFVVLIAGFNNTKKIVIYERYVFFLCDRSLGKFFSIQNVKSCDNFAAQSIHL